MRARFAAGAAFVLASFGCVGRNPPPNAPPPTPSAEAPAPVPSPAAPGPVTEARLLELEDRRLFDAGVLGAEAADPGPAARARAALALGRIDDERAVPLLRKLAGDSSSEVRRQAAFAAGILRDPALVGALAPLLADPDASVAAQAAWALSAVERPEAETALVGALAAAPPDRRPALLRALWRYPTPTAAAAALAHASDADPLARAAALYALARRPQEASRAALAAALSDPAVDADTAAVCARALGILGKPESVAPLWAAVGDGRSPVRIAALLALAAVLERSPGAALPEDAPARLVALSSDTNPSLAVPALALSRWAVADRDVFRRLWSIASSGRGRRQQVALSALMAGLGERSKDLVDQAIASPDPFLRGTAAESLSFLPAADAAARRAKLAADPEVFVRLKLLEGLRTPESVAQNRALVDAALADPDPGVQGAAVDALAQLENPSMLPVIRDAVVRSYGGTAPDVAMEAIAAAEGHADDPAAREILEAAYAHPSVLVSRLARRSLVRKFHADPAAFPWKAYPPKDPEEYARAAASEREPQPVVRIETERGTFVVRLTPATTPFTVQNFLSLARRGYFDGVRIHRVAPGFVVQDGDPTGTGNGGPGYEIRDELTATPYETGTVGMALAGADTGGSQWFVTLAPEPHLDGGYTAFGRVVAGMEIVGRIEQGDRIVRVAAPAERTR
ncbi:MAG TPA: peptidylprolyl isomerase [Thermoanaerobaculia bacterium]|jgi:cyclophilin family peptidyl-prolyl cis-trans isomerase/HEAT repeat protein